MTGLLFYVLILQIGHFYVKC